MTGPLPPIAYETSIAVAADAVAAGAARIPAVAVAVTCGDAGPATLWAPVVTATLGPHPAVTRLAGDAPLTHHSSGHRWARLPSPALDALNAALPVPGVTVTVTGRRADVTVTGPPARGVDLSALAAGTSLRIGELTELLTKLRRRGLVYYETGRPGALARLAATADHSVIGVPRRGAPGIVELTWGTPSPGGQDHWEDPGPEPTDQPDPPRQFAVPSSELFDQVDTIDDRLGLALHPASIEAAALAEATPAGRAGLLGWQDEFCSRYQRSSAGLACCTPPGMGKTIAAAVALAEDAAGRSSWTALVSVPAALVPQWVDELTTWFVPRTGGTVTTVNRWDPPTAPGALVVVATHDEAAALTGTGRLAAVTFDHLVVDEAAVLRSRSRRSRGLWKLRGHARKAMALTGTPVESSADDPGGLLAFVADDTSLFRGAPLRSRWDRNGHPRTGPPPDQQLDGAEDPGTEDPGGDGDRGRFGTVPGPDGWDFLTELGPRLYVKDRQASPLPAVTGQLHLLETPTDPEVLTASSALVAAVDALRGTAAAPALTQPGKEGSQARLRARDARMATISAWRALRRSFRHQTGTQTWATEILTGTAAAGQCSIVFCDEPDIAHQLAETLTVAGLRAAAVTGSTSGRDRTTTIDSFDAGALDALVLTAALSRGMNLQVAGAVLHLDLPEQAAQLTQRNARVARMGSTKDQILVHLCAPTHGPQRHAVQVLASQAGLSLGDTPLTIPVADDGDAGILSVAAAVADQIAGAARLDDR